MKNYPKSKLDSCFRIFAAILAYALLIALFVGAARKIEGQYIQSKNALESESCSFNEEESYSSFPDEIMAIDSHQENYEGLYGEIADKNDILERLQAVKPYVSITLSTDLDRIIDLADSTKLNLQESALLLGYCDKMNFRPSIILGLIELESNFKKYEVGTSRDRGYMQIIPGTEKWLAYRYGYRLKVKYNPDNIFEPEYNFALGIIYLDHLKRVHGDDYHKILSEYNRGPYNLKKYYDKHNTYKTTYSTIVLRKSTKYRRFDLD